MMEILFASLFALALPILFCFLVAVAITRWAFRIDDLVAYTRRTALAAEEANRIQRERFREMHERTGKPSQWGEPVAGGYTPRKKPQLFGRVKK